MIPRDEATTRQINAARPNVSTWLSANAGSGKTRVLTDRVARLLFNGTPPQRILCLTYTKAAASEMQNRLFARLGTWTMLPDDALRLQLRELGIEDDLPSDRLSWARTLFAAAIETPGGLKIQTVHAFCAAVLRQFPLEAGVTPQFKEMDDTQTLNLRDTVLSDYLSTPKGRAEFEALVALKPKLDVAGVLANICSRRPQFTTATAEGITAQLEIEPTLTLDDVLSVYSANDTELLSELALGLRAAQGSTTKTFVKNLTALPDAPIAEVIPTLERVLLTGPKTKVPFSAKNLLLITKSDHELVPDLLDPLCDLCARVEATFEDRRCVVLRDQSLILLGFGQGYLEEYQAAKDLRGLLDFDDLILKTRALLSDQTVAQWVLFRLDGGIDHILVDEAQDTSPAQWEVIQQLSEEFGAGQGAREDLTRTIFVVGDKKQSIYSFQGADPSEFDRMRDAFQNKIEGSGAEFSREELKHSFRSSSAILRMVDQVYAHDQGGLGEVSDHVAFKSTLPGRVDVWPVVEKIDDPTDTSWDDPIDLIAGDDPASILADTIAQSIRDMIANDTLPNVAANGTVSRRAIMAGDILVLVQGRTTPIFQAIIAACKRYNIPIAGADRLKLSAELAVKDLIAMLSFLALPEDDLSLACVLRSPLLGWSEQDLFTLAHGRNGSFLWKELRDQEARYPETIKTLTALRNIADFNRPYEILELILGRFDGRRKLIARLGSEAEEAIDALLSMALEYERNDVPSLTGFLVWFGADGAEIKRQAEGAGDKLRVMTAHGAKGLEAPIVILPDTAKRKPPDARTVVFSDGQPLLSMPQEDGPTRLSEIKAQAARPSELERDRLLYVAMTRAENWLICCAAGEVGTDSPCWYDRIDQAAIECGAKPLLTGLGPGRRLEFGNWTDGDIVAVTDETTTSVDLEPYFHTPAPKALPALDPQSASKFDGAKALPVSGQEMSSEEAKRLGTAIHKLLEVLPQQKLPPDKAHRFAAHILTTDFPDLSATQGERALTETSALLADPAFKAILDQNVLFEVECFVAHPGGPGITGVIDLLCIQDDRVTIYDYKTNRAVPDNAQDTPKGLLRQMGAYARAIQAAYPDRLVETAIIWTVKRDIMILPQDLISDAIQDVLSA